MNGGKPNGILSLALVVPAQIFGSVAKLRGLLYDKGVLKTVRADVPVISVGNLTAGGTGKTPITSFLAHDLVKRGFTVGIVSRGYRGTETGPATVSPDGTSTSAARFGDEPTWLASQHPECVVVVGAQRPEAIAFLNDRVRANSTTGKRVVVADDAFQHRRLKRDIDVVVVDPTEPRWHYQPLPLGRMREGFSALRRAQFVFLSKTNLIPAKDLEWIRAKLRSEQSRAKFKIVEFGVRLAGVVSLERNRTADAPAPRELSKVVLMSGLARPETFQMMVEQSHRVFGAVKIIEHFMFKDHHAFSNEELARVEEKAFREKADAIVITEKDAVKLDGWMPQVPVFVTRLIAEPLTHFQEFHEAVDRLN